MSKDKKSKKERKQTLIKIGCLVMVVAMVIPAVSPIINAFYQEEEALSAEDLNSVKAEIESQGYKIIENEDGTISIELSAEQSAALAVQEDQISKEDSEQNQSLTNIEDALKDQNSETNQDDK